jgi:ankyrin repeat protein
MTPLMVALPVRLEDIVELLFLAGAKLEARCDQGRSALTSAAASGHIPIAKFLLSKGAMVDP